MTPSYYDRPTTDSWCTSGQPVSYWWVNGRTLEGISAIDEKMRRIELVLAAWDWNEFDLEDELGAMEEILERALAGRLTMIDEVKRLHRGFPFRIFEIRLSAVAKNRTKVGERTVAVHEEQVHIRVYHAEEPTLPRCALGLEVRRKLVVADDPHATRMLQNEDIDAALRVLHAGRENRWGIP